MTATSPHVTTSPRRRRSGSQKRKRTKQVNLTLFGYELAALDVLAKDGGHPSVQEFIRHRLGPDIQAAAERLGDTTPLPHTP